MWTRDRLTDPMLRHSPAAQRLVDASAPRAYLAVPIISREETHGVLVVYFFTPHDFTTREVQLVSTLADHAAVALQNARLFEQTRRREREAQTLYEETQTQRVRLAQIFDSTSDGIVLVSRAGEIQSANRQAGELLGFDASDVIGSPPGRAAGRLPQRGVRPRARVRRTSRALFDDPEHGGEGDLELRRTGRTVHWVGPAHARTPPARPSGSP